MTPTTKLTLAEIEAALDQSRLYAITMSGSTVRVRRNGKTRTWKTRPGEFRIPLKHGLYGYYAVTNFNADNFRVFPEWDCTEEPGPK